MRTRCWKPIQLGDLTGLYDVSDDGLIRGHHKGHVGIKTPKRSRHGYLHVVLCYGKLRRYALVHRLVIEAFGQGTCDAKLFVNHINGNKADNQIANLEWVTQKENTQHAARTRLMAFGERNSHAKITATDVIDIRASEETGVALAKRYGLHKQTISRIKMRRIWPHV